MLDFHQVDALAHQAVELLLPDADLSIAEAPRNSAYVYPDATGGDHGLWHVTVTIAEGNSAVLSVNPDRTPAEALADLIAELSGATHGQFRGRYFPECPSHEHPASVAADGDSVILSCPEEGRVVATLAPSPSFT